MNNDVDNVLLKMCRHIISVTRLSALRFNGGCLPNESIIFKNLFKVRLNYIIKLNRTKSGATYMAQNLNGLH